MMEGTLSTEGGGGGLTSAPLASSFFLVGCYHGRHVTHMPAVHYFCQEGTEPPALQQLPCHISCQCPLPVWENK
ncbi:hypothetical protein PBY51_019562 [Eleginops maclovinus]|uniref:Uncharacterized protein n=1 Tax=Eleginops maclovinus TaxID=56733 RepID=A0AAN8AY49_ELEMC|nr:hypothetical protein PBY51_019562 [Eleginops maclovinus]